MATHHYFRSKDEKFLDRVPGRKLLLNLLDLAVRCDGVVNGDFEINIILAIIATIKKGPERSKRSHQ